jgi:UDP-galactopyranose mutase
MIDLLVVGAGFAGASIARLAADDGYKVLVLDRREYLGGNASDCFDQHGVLVHPHGPHIFHTNSEAVWKFLSRFTAWRHYEHRVLASIEGMLLPIPINRTTLNQLFKLQLDSDEAVQHYLDSVRTHRQPVRSSEDLVLNSVGEVLCSLFFRGYTRKQWGMDLSELLPGVAARIPVRTNADDRYFTDLYQAMPDQGYSVMFRRMLDHPGIELQLCSDYFDLVHAVPARHTVYTGPIDRFFEYRFGPLPYRSLRFEHEHLPATRRFQPVGTVNFPNEFAYTRITEFRHLTGQSHAGTSIVKEYPTSGGEPYYPIPTQENDQLFKRYQKLADDQTGVSFIGRLAQYRYYNMDQVVAQAIVQYPKIIEQLTLAPNQ